MTWSDVDCPVCEQRVSRTRSGVMAEHRDVSGVACRGSGKTVLQGWDERMGGA